MRLCHIVPSLEAQYGGPSKSVRSLCEALARAGDDVQLLTTHPDAAPHGDSQSHDTLRIETFARDWPQRLCPSRGLRGAADASDAPIFHHHALWLRTLHYAHCTARRRGASLVVSPRGMMSTWAWRHRSGRKRFARAFVHPGALEAVGGWHATSAEEEAEIRALGFKQPICVAPNGVESVDTADTTAAAEYWHHACPATASRPVALFYSRFHEKKRVLELIDTWIQQAPAEWVLLLVGIPQDYTPERLEAHALERSGPDRVFAFSGAGRPPPYAVASLFVLPSHNENFGLAVAEAMAHGVPVLVTDTTPWSAVQRLEHGWCVSWEQFGATLQTALNEGVDRLRARGARAREWVVREFAWEHAARTLQQFYRSLREVKR